MAKSAYREKPEDIHAQNLSVLKERIKNKDVCASYVFYGDEEYTKNHYFSQLCLQSLDKSLNTTTITGSDFNLADFMCACSTSAVQSIDMFSLDDDDDEQSSDDGIRVIRLIDPDLSVLSKKDEEFFMDTISNPPENSVIVFWFYSGQTDFLSKEIYKTICKKCLVVNFKREPVGSSVLITWILRHFARAKINIDRNVAVSLCSVVGNSMTDLKNEIDKCIEYLYFENRDTLTLDDVNFICIKSTEAQVFDISTGALSGNFPKAALALSVLRDKKEKPLLIFGSISKAINDLCTVDNFLKRGILPQEISKQTGIRDFVVKRNITVLTDRSRDFKGYDSFIKTISNLCLEYDDKLKSSRTDGYELLLEFIFKLSFAGKVSIKA